MAKTWLDKQLKKHRKEWAKKNQQAIDEWFAKTHDLIMERNAQILGPDFKPLPPGDPEKVLKSKRKKPKWAKRKLRILTQAGWQDLPMGNDGQYLYQKKNGEFVWVYFGQQIKDL